MLVINLFGGPGVGKSATAHGLMYEMKRAGHRVEFASEYAKDLVMDENWELLADQKHVADEQHRRVARFSKMADIVINEAPVLNGIIYTPEDYPEDISDYYVELWNQFNNFNFLITRCFPYQTAGRYQDEAGAHKVDEKIKLMLNNRNVEYTTFPAVTAVEQILLMIENRLKEEIKTENIKP